MELQLLTVVCLDGSGGGAFPVAYCVTGQVERRSALTFLRCVRAALGAPVEAEALVSDDVPALVSAWQEVMGQPRHCFLCSWSVDQAWRESIKCRIPRKKLQAFAYKVGLHSRPPSGAPSNSLFLFFPTLFLLLLFVPVYGLPSPFPFLQSGMAAKVSAFPSLSLSVGGGRGGEGE